MFIRNLSIENIQNQLCKAVYENDLKRVRLLLDRGATIDYQDKYGTTVLFWAAFKGHLEMVCFLLDRGATINHLNKLGDTALFWAVTKAHLETVRLLLDRGATIDDTNQDGDNVLTNASNCGNKEIIEVIEKQIEKQKEEVKSFFSGKSGAKFFLPLVIVESVVNAYLGLESSPQPRKP